MNITLEFPDQFVRFFSEESIKRELLLNNALMLFRQGRISLSRAANLAHISIYDFLHECKVNHIPVIEQSPEDITREISGL